MTQTTALALALGLFGLFGVDTVAAQECPSSAPNNYEITDDEVKDLYACIEASMVASYTKGDNPVAKAYRTWAVSGTRPGPDASHGDRFLLTFANDIAAESYLRFATQDTKIPVGGILAKESFTINKGMAKVGPLFIMEKVGLDAAPEADGWLYSAVQPNGKMMGIKQSFCHDCHVAFEGQDSLAYPAEDYRVKK